MILNMELGERSYDILIERGCLQQAGRLLHLNRKVCIVTDEGVPRQYVEKLAAQCERPVIVTVDAGEETKTMETVTKLCRVMLERGFSRKDCVAAVGGGMVGDLAGFAAACFMRGVDFYNVPTTLLSQVDSSIGGKTGVNLDGVKNIVGAFWQPQKVLIDPDTLDTLSPRLYAEGMAEAVKMALASDEKLFAQLEQGDLPVEELLYGALSIKKTIVEQDERESGIRKLLNFGHTIGHGVESAAKGSLYHGECVAIGMIPMLGHKIREQVAAVLTKYGLPTKSPVPAEKLNEAMSHDKKVDGSFINAVFVPEAGEFEIKKLKFEDFANLIKESL